MEIKGKAQLLRIFVGDSDKIDHVNVYEKIVLLAREASLAGATVFKGTMGYGRSSRIHSSKFLAISDDLPVIIEIVDETEKIDAFIPTVKDIFKKSGCGGMITVEYAKIIKYVEKKEE